MMLNWFSAAFRFLIGIVHRFAIFVSAEYSSLNIASSFGKETRFWVTFRRDKFSDSMASV